MSFQREKYARTMRPLGHFQRSMGSFDRGVGIFQTLQIVSAAQQDTGPTIGTLKKRPRRSHPTVENALPPPPPPGALRHTRHDMAVA